MEGIAVYLDAVLHCQTEYCENVTRFNVTNTKQLTTLAQFVKIIMDQFENEMCLL